MAPHKTSDMQKNGEQITVSVSECAETQLRVPAVNADLYIEKPGVARANQAVSAETPQGSVSYSERYKDYVRMKRHLTSLRDPEY